MNCAPYKTLAERTKEGYREISKILGLHPVIIREVYFNRWFTGMDIRDFFALIKSGEIKREEFDGVQFTDEEIAKKQRTWNKAVKDNEFSDQLSYQLKQLIEVGDETVCDETKTFCFSNKQYLTAGKKYKIIELNDKRDTLTGFTAITNTDLEGERNWESNHSVRSLWRNNKEIWNWNVAYYNLWIEQNPKDKDNVEFKEHSMRSAEKARKGERD